MAKAVINLQKESGGITKISSADGTGVTELVVPESGNLVSVDTAVTDNAIARYDGTTGKLQNSGVIVDDNDRVYIGKLNTAPLLVLNRGTDGQSLGYLGNTSASSVDMNLINASGTGNLNLGAGNNANVRILSGNLLLTSGTGALGYGAGAGGTVTQLTSKSTAVTVNKPCGVIITHSSALAAGALASFTFNKSFIKVDDILIFKIGTAGSRYSIDANISAEGSAGINIINRTAASYSDSLIISFAIVRGSNA